MALFWACADLLQVRSATGAQPFPALAAMVLALYAAIGAATGIVTVGLLASRPEGRRPRAATLVAMAFVAFALAGVAGFLNVAFLPGILEPLTIAANLALLLAAGGLWLALSRSAWVQRLALSRVAAVVIGLSAVAASMLAGAGSPPDESAASHGVANPSAASVFVIVIDSLRYDRTSGGAGSVSMPALDRLAREGTRFDRAYAQSSWTKPSVASLFTSLYPKSHQANSRRAALGSAGATMPGVFAAAGYRTAVFSANPWIAPAFGFDHGVSHFFEADRETFARFVILLRSLKAMDHLLPQRPIAAGLARLQGVFGLQAGKRTNCERDRAIVGALEQWLDSGAGPVFAYFHLMSPHIPYEPPAGFDVGGEPFPGKDQIALLSSTEPLDPVREARLVELYSATVRHADDVLARIRALLQERAFYRDSIVVVSADHGEEFHDHGHWGHGKSVYDELVRVPLVMRGPGIPAAGVVEEPAMHVDLLPTLARLAAIAPDPRWEGADLLQPLEAARPAYAELLREGGFEATMAYRERKKAIGSVEALGREPRTEIYDLEKDPGETQNLFGETTGKGSLVALLEGFRREATAGSTQARPAAMDAATDERLKALGYLD